MNLAAWAAAFAGSTAFLLAVVAAVWWFDRYDREPLGLVAAVFLWGALAAPAGSVAVEIVAGVLVPLHGVQALVVAPVAEELAKGLAVLLVILLSSQFDNPTDGIVYGTAAGLGFAVTENAVATLGAAPGDGLWGVTVVRTLASSGVHAVATAALGGFLGIAYLSRSAARRLTWGGIGFGVAVVLHALWNGTVLAASSGPSHRPVVAAAAGLAVAYTAYGVVLVGFLSWERRVLRRQLEEEVRLGVLPAWVSEVIPHYRRRIRGDWWPDRRGRTVLARLLTRLAFRKHAVACLPEGEAELAGLEVVRLRERVLRILGAGGGGSSPGGPGPQT